MAYLDAPEIDPSMWSHNAPPHEITVVTSIVGVTTIIGVTIAQAIWAKAKTPVTEVAAMTAKTAMASEAAVASAVTSEAAAVPTAPAMLRCRRSDVAQHADAHQKSHNGGPLHAFSDLCHE